MSEFSELKNKILQKKAVVSVLGLGYVGLPLAVQFAKKGFKVYGLENSKNRLKKAQKKECYIEDVDEKLFKKVISNKKLIPTSDFSKISLSDVIIICVPTPLKRKYTPDISYILKAVKTISKFEKKGTLIILESTTFPGTTDEFMKPILEKKGLNCGKDFFLAFSPERIDPGNKKFPVYKIPKIVGGITPNATELAACFYGTILKKVVKVSSSRVAETAKLLENTFRIVNIALVNELAQLAHKLNIDIWEVIEAAKTKPFGFMPFYPGPGCGGHCIPDDPLYLYWKSKKHGFTPRFIKLASDTNSNMPKYVVNRIKNYLGNPKKRKILVVGATYKKDVKDLRKSPSIDIIHELLQNSFRVDYYDPIIPYLKFNGIDLRSIYLNAKTLEAYDCVIIATDHTDVNYKLILKKSKLIFDTRNVYANINNERIIKL